MVSTVGALVGPYVLVSVGVTVPVLGSTLYVVVVVTVRPSGSVVVSTFGFVPTLITVSVGCFVRTGSPTVGVIAPVLGSTVYVVVIVSSPGVPSSLTGSESLSRLVSPS